jgi:hypothetical protein
MVTRWAVTVAAVLGASLAVAAPASASAQLEVGVGRADITPPTGYYMMGWVRSDALVIGQNTRLLARVIVLREGDRKIALIAEDLNGIPGGMLAAAADMNRDIGFSQQNVLDSATHTHAAPTGFYNLASYNSVFFTITSPTKFDLTGSIDPQLYAFEVRQLALAIRRANADLGPGKVGWGFTQLLGVTQNRSLEAHLANFGIQEGYGVGSVGQDPGGYPDTIDPAISVLRVDKLVGGRDVPVGMWSTFANHGTVDKFQFTYYNADHLGVAMQIVESQIRAAGHVPAGQDVIDAYGNSDEGDQTSGIVRSGPAAADWVGQQEAQAFLAAWRQAGQSMSSSPQLDLRWTRTCWCGQQTPDGPVATSSQLGLAEFTGSEEGRGPLFDVTRIPFEGDHLSFSTGTQGDKIVVPLPFNAPQAVPMMALRVADRMIVSIPGEMTVEMGRRVRGAVLQATGGAGINGVVISGLANDYADYFTTPQEYDAQHYEGAATVYGRASSDLLQQVLVDLSRDLVSGAPAPTPSPYDPRNGVDAGAPPFPTGASTANVVAQPPTSVQRLGHPTFSWQGAAKGYDRPLDRAFVTVRRLATVPPAAACASSRVVTIHLTGRVRRLTVLVNGRRRQTLHGAHRRVRVSLRGLPKGVARVVIRVVTDRGSYSIRRTYHPCSARAAQVVWQPVDSDLGRAMLWSVDDNGVYRAEWEPPLDAPTGTYRFEITANHYSLTSRTFELAPSAELSAARADAPPGQVALTLDYPAAQQHEDVGALPPDASADLTYRPAHTASGHLIVLVNGATVSVTAGGDGVFRLNEPSGTRIEVTNAAGQDAYGNNNGNDLSFMA